MDYQGIIKYQSIAKMCFILQLKFRTLGLLDTSASGVMSEKKKNGIRASETYVTHPVGTVHHQDQLSHMYCMCGGNQNMLLPLVVQKHNLVMGSTLTVYNAKQV